MLAAAASQGIATLPARPSSLLSRIEARPSHVIANHPASDSNRGLKRRFTDEDERSSKRRSSSQKEEQQYEDINLFAPWMKDVDSLDSQASRENRLHHELLDFVKYITPSEKERQVRTMLVEHITELIRARWSDANVTLFGSSATGLELSGGDIDLVIAFDSNSKFTDQDKKRRLAAIGDLLRKAGLTTWVNRIFGAKVPIIAFTTKQNLGEISIDISIRNDEDSGPRAIPIVKQYLQEMPALRTLIHAIKAFLSFRDLNDASQATLSSYAITVMCISFLQRNPSRRPQAHFDDPSKENAFGTLLMDFFRHYGHGFSYATHYISVTDKGIFSKKSKGWEPKGAAVLAVQCLLNPDNNITRGCSRIGLVVEAFQQAHHALQTAQYSPTDPSTASLLWHIYEIPDELDFRRREIEQSLDSGTFSQALQSIRAETRGAQALSGGVSLSGSGRVYDLDTTRRPRMNGPRAIHVPPSSVQQLPPLRLGRNPPVINSQFHFQYQPEAFIPNQFAQSMALGHTPFGLQQAPLIDVPNRSFNNRAPQRQHNRDGGRHVHSRRY